MVISEVCHVKIGSGGWPGPEGLFPHGMGYFSTESYFNLNEEIPCQVHKFHQNIAER